MRQPARPPWVPDELYPFESHFADAAGSLVTAAPTAVFPREILGSRSFLAETERRLPRLRGRPALIVWPTRDVAFRDRERRRCATRRLGCRPWT